jgi:hypothetical protein
MEELSAWIGEDEGRLQEVATLVRSEQDVNLWAPAMFAISRSPAPGKRRFLLEVIRSESDSGKVWHAVLAGFEGGTARGYTSLPSGIHVSHTDHHDPDLVKAAVDQLQQSTDESLKFWVAQALEPAAHRDEAVRQAMVSVFASPNESEEVRARLAYALAFSATKDSGVFDAARFILQDPAAGEQLLTACVDLMGTVDKIESANVLTDVLIADGYPEPVRSYAARMIRQSHFSGDARIVESVLASYGKQPAAIRKDLLAVLEESGSAGVAARIRALPAEQDEQLRLYREQVVASLEKKSK